MISDHPCTAAISISLVLLIAANHALADWWNLFRGFVRERRTRGTMKHRSMTPTVFCPAVLLPALIFGSSGLAIAGPPVVVEIHAPAWCKPCQKIAPAVSRLNAEGYSIQQVDFDGRAEQIVTPGQVAKQSGHTWARAFGITTVPAFVVIDTTTFKHRTAQDVRTEQQLRAFLKQNGIVPHAKP